MSLGGEIATHWSGAWLDTAAEGIEQQAAIAALHHRLTQAREPHGPIAKVVGLPAALGHAAGPEESLGDVPIARFLEPAIERAQRERSADHVERRVISPGSRPGKRPVKPRQSRSAAAARISNSRSSGRTTQGTCSPGDFEDVQAEQAAPPIDQPTPVHLRQRPVRAIRASACRFRSARSRRERGYGDHARQARRRPQSVACGATGLGHYEIAPPSAARNHPVRRR